MNGRGVPYETDETQEATLVLLNLQEDGFTRAKSRENKGVHY